jgi:hypothetical protein
LIPFGKPKNEKALKISDLQGFDFFYNPILSG